MTIEAERALSFAIVNPNALRHIWDALLPLVETACSYTDDELTPPIVANAVLDGQMQLLCLHDGEQPHSVMITMGSKPANAEFARLEVLAVGGRNMKAWAPFEPELHALAKRMGCDRLRAKTRKGMAKALPDWELKAYIMERMI